MKSSKSQIHAKFHKIPMIRFEDQQLTSFSGLLVFQMLFKRLDLKKKLKDCFDHLMSFSHFRIPFGCDATHRPSIVGFRRIREIDYYRDDPLVLRIMGLRKNPDVSTISRKSCQDGNTKR